MAQRARLWFGWFDGTLSDAMRREFVDVLRTLATRHALTLLAVLAVVLGVWAFVSLIDTVSEGHSQKFDERVIHWCVAHPGPQWLQDSGRDITALGGVTVIAMVTAAAVGFLLISRKRGAAALLVVAVLGGLLISGLIKHFMHRDRPPRDLQEAYVFTHSFPSGHSMLSAIIYLTIGALLAQVTRGRWLKLYLIALALLLTFLVGLSRVYLRVHWPTDVLAGWSAGLTWAILCLVVARQLQHRGAVETEETSAKP
ncbi:MAG TPA: phosphatase PAP2 family protein [Tepidisphaeraceae bacterium]|nr:phosphatase PAP2 family protein [Tepidisphaeraceae bacterium]